MANLILYTVHFYWSQAINLCYEVALGYYLVLNEKAGCTDEILLVCLVEELLQQLGPEFVQHLFQVDIGASVVVPQIREQVREDLGILGVY